MNTTSKTTSRTSVMPMAARMSAYDEDAIASVDSCLLGDDEPRDKEDISESLDESAR